MVAKKRRGREDVEAEIGRARRADEAMVTEQGSAGTVSMQGLAPKLDHADLRGVDLSRLDLTDASLTYADLRDAILEGTILAGAYLNHADLRGTTRTEGADLTDATMHFACLEEADLARATLGSAYAGSLTNATYDGETRWPRGFDPQAHGARRVGKIVG